MNLTIVVTVFNEKAEIVKSLLSKLQKLEGKEIQIEIIIIIDNPKRDLAEFHQNEACTKYIEIIQNIDNIGVGAARNVGIQAALSKNASYIAFVDADDSINIDGYKQAISYLLTMPTLDILTCGFRNKDRIQGCRPITTLNDWCYGQFTRIGAFFVSSMYLKEKNIRFKNSSIGEDVEFIFKAIITGSWQHLPIPIYEYASDSRKTYIIYPHPTIELFEKLKPHEKNEFRPLIKLFNKRNVRNGLILRKLKPSGNCFQWPVAVLIYALGKYVKSYKERSH
jgi:glycosyltransferase involved in cell wall biosynthesis